MAQKPTQDTEAGKFVEVDTGLQTYPELPARPRISFSVSGLSTLDGFFSALLSSPPPAPLKIDRGPLFPHPTKGARGLPKWRKVDAAGCLKTAPKPAFTSLVCTNSKKLALRKVRTNRFRKIAAEGVHPKYLNSCPAKSAWEAEQRDRRAAA